MSVHRWVRASISILGVAWLCVVACSNGSSKESSETHFLSTCDGECGAGAECLCGVCTRACRANDECSPLHERSVCVQRETTGLSCEGASAARLCDVECMEGADCSSLGQGFRCVEGRCRQPVSADEPPRVDACPAGCQEVRVYPMDAERECLDTDSGISTACACEEGGEQGCIEWEADGSLWHADNRASLLSENAGARGWRECSVEEGLSLGPSCDFLECPGGASSSCSMEDTCATVERDFDLACGGELSPFREDGCSRESCERSADCEAGEKCGFFECVSGPSCSYGPGGACGCRSLTVCFPGSYCVPENAEVPARDWTSFTIDQGAGPCPGPPPECTWQWTVTPDGMVASNKEGVMAQTMLSEVDRAAVFGILESDELLVAMLQGFSCDPPPTDVGFSFAIELGTARYEQDVTGCVLTGPEENDAELLWNLLRSY